MKMDRAGVVPKRVNVLIGDQGSEVDMARWIKESGGEFDAIVDDGSHKNHHIYKSLQYLWRNALAPGGCTSLRICRYHETVEITWTWRISGPRTQRRVLAHRCS